MMKKIVLVFSTGILTLAAYAQNLKEAIKLTDNEQYEAAAGVLQILISQQPGNAVNYYYLGENYLLSDNADSAQMMYEMGEKKDPNNVLFLIGHAKYNLNKFNVNERLRISQLAASDPDKSKAAEAQATYQTAVTLVKDANTMIDQAVLKSGGKNVNVLLEAADALIHFKNKDLDKAKTFLDKALVLEARNTDILIEYGDVYSELNNGTLAADYYNKALEIDKNSVKSIVSKGRLYKRSTNYEGAAEEFKNAIRIEPDFAPAHRELGEIYFKLNQLDNAKQEYRKYLDLSKNNCGARIRYSSFLYLSKDYAGALNEIKQIQEKCDKDNLTLLRISSYCYYETKDSANAMMAALKLFLKLTEDKTTALDYEYYGKILALNNHDSIGVGMLRKAYQMDNSRCDLLNEIWKSYDKMKDNAGAAAVLLEKIQNCKGATVADYFNLGRSYFFAGDFMKADTAFTKVNTLSPKYASGFLWRAKANSHIDSTSSLGLAKPHYEKYIEIATGDSTAGAAVKYKNGLIESYRYLASYYYIQMKDKESTKSFLRKIIALDPSDTDAQKSLDGIEKQEKQEREKLKKSQ